MEILPIEKHSRINHLNASISKKQQLKPHAYNLKIKRTFETNIYLRIYSFALHSSCLQYATVAEQLMINYIYCDGKCNSAK